MINLTTNWPKSTTVFCALVATLTLLLTTLVVAQEAPAEPIQSQSPASLPLETSDGSAVKPLPTDILDLQPAQQKTQQSVLAGSFDSPQDQEVDALDPNQNVEPEVMMRGPLHEAFADAYQADPQPNPIIDATPPEPINELPPEFKPAGENVQWIPGYWAWDEIQSDFMWISGLWRDIPPGQRWISGFWEQAETGYRWTSGFWTNEAQEQLSYLPEPPASLDRGPSIASPGDNYFYCPGNWEYQTDNYVWRAGHWQPRVESWVWIPARYVWTPRGCIYRNGYWDYEFDDRGIAFAPVWYPQPIYRTVGYQYRPSYCIDIGPNFLVHMFVRPKCNQYFYGDWYDTFNRTTQYRPWINQQSHYRSYDPLLAHYGGNRYRHNGVQLLSWVNNQHRYYADHRDVRPPVSLHLQANLKGSKFDQKNQDFLRRATLANNYTTRIRQQPNDQRGRRDNALNENRPERNFVRLDPSDQKRIVENQKVIKDKEAMRRRQDAQRQQLELNSEELVRSRDRQKRDFESRAKVDQSNAARDRTSAWAAQRQRDEVKRADEERDLDSKLRKTTEQSRLEFQQQQIQRNRAEFARSQERIQRQAESRAGLDESSAARDRASAWAAQRQRDEVKRAREERDLASKLQKTTEQSRLEAQQQQIQRNREEFARSQERIKRQADRQSQIDRDNSQRDKAQRDQAQRDQAQRDQAQRDQAQRDQTQRDQAQRDAQQAAQRQQQEQAARVKAEQDRRAQEQAKQARDKAQRDAQDRAREQKQRADQARKAQEERQRRSAEQQRKQQREKEREANKPKKNK